MNEDVKKLWTDALDSGKYKQGQGNLRTDNEYCCLGVLCELAAQRDICNRVRHDDGNFVYDGKVGFLPASVMNWAGLTETDPHIHNNASTLSRLNDDHVPFPTISTFIKEQL